MTHSNELLNIEYDKSILSLILWSTSLQKRVFNAWQQYTSHRKKKQAREEAAFEFYRRNLMREGLVQSLIKATQYKTTRQRDSANILAYQASKLQNKVEKFYFHWRSIVLKRKKEKIENNQLEKRPCIKEINMPIIRRQPRKPIFLCSSSSKTNDNKNANDTKFKSEEMYSIEKVNISAGHNSINTENLKLIPPSSFDIKIPKATDKIMASQYQTCDKSNSNKMPMTRKELNFENKINIKKTSTFLLKPNEINTNSKPITIQQPSKKMINSKASSITNNDEYNEQDNYNNSNNKVFTNRENIDDDDKFILTDYHVLNAFHQPYKSDCNDQKEITTLITDLPLHLDCGMEDKNMSDDNLYKVSISSGLNPDSTEPLEAVNNNLETLPTKISLVKELLVLRNQLRLYMHTKNEQIKFI